MPKLKSIFNVTYDQQTFRQINLLRGCPRIPGPKIIYNRFSEGGVGVCETLDGTNIGIKIKVFDFLV